jgi:predicted amidohydrolase YtcJ
MAGPADLVLHGGSVLTMDAAGIVASAVAIRAGRIVGVGLDREILGFRGRTTEVIDLRGRSLVPGFGDAHVHLGKGGLDRLRIDLSTAHDLEEYGRIVRSFSGAHPGGDWLTGGGWSMTTFPGGTPTAAMLDAFVADRPVFLNNRDNHGGWVNSAGLRAAGISAATPDPPDGRLERDATGEPTGCLHEGAMRLVTGLLPEPSEAELVAALLEGQRHLHSLGVTQWQDAIVGRYDPMPDTFEAYRTIAADGRLTGRAVLSLWLPRGPTGDDLELICARRDSGRIGRLRATTVKIMADGVCENFTAAMLSPYLDADGAATTNRGISFFDREELERLIPLLDGEGFQVHVHVIGDRACRDALDAIAEARRRNGWLDTRPHLAHLQVVDPADITRFRELGVTATFQPLWAAGDPQLDELTIPFLGPDRSAAIYPIGAVAATGAGLAFGSDWPISSADPLAEMRVAVTRTRGAADPYGAPVDEPFLPAQRITLGTALRAFTMGTAYVNHLEAETGSIEVGKAADLAVLDRDLRDDDGRALDGARALLTLVDGAIVHADPALG